MSAPFCSCYHGHCHNVKPNTRISGRTLEKQCLSLHFLTFSQLPSVRWAEGRSDPGVSGRHSLLSALSLLPHEEAAEEEDLPELAASHGAPRAVLGETPAGSEGQRRSLWGQVPPQCDGQTVMERTRNPKFTAAVVLSFKSFWNLFLSYCHMYCICEGGCCHYVL